MNIILFTTTSERAGSLNLSRPQVYLPIFGLLLMLAAMLVYGGYRLAPATGSRVEQAGGSSWRAELASQRQDILAARASAQSNLDALAMRIGRMQAQVMRLEALGQQLVTMADLDEGEFDFNSLPAQGGSSDPHSLSPTELPDFLNTLNELNQQLDDRERQLDVLSTLIMNRNLHEQVYPAGRPVNSGWLSSYYGKRTDPFTGKRDFHKGVDFAGKQGSEVVAVAAGVVSMSKRKTNYGYLVEINHGNGYVTRYAHNKQNLVKVGDTVKKGQVIALMGTTGRSTGPHVHFEVLRDGKTVDPARYIQAAR